ncbi:MAG: PorT family protein [Muribaculaceae bacterium]|nr:PorT family protein [Muribaculaceae bacterium]
MIACTGQPLSAEAQEAIDAGVDTAPMWGVKASFDINIPGQWHRDAGGSIGMYRFGYGGAIGAVCNLYLGHNFYIEPGVSLFYDRYRYKDIVFPADYDGDVLETDPPIYKIGVRVPVVAGYSFTIAGALPMSVYTGPELNYSFGGGIMIKNRELRDELRLFGKNGFQRRVDCAWKVGAGFPYGSWFISVDGSFGLTDLLTNPNISFRENRVAVSVTRYF